MDEYLPDGTLMRTTEDVRRCDICNYFLNYRAVRCDVVGNGILDATLCVNCAKQYALGKRVDYATNVAVRDRVGVIWEQI